jgi:hypothetical protein
MSNLRLPGQPPLAVDLSSDGEGLGALQQTRAEDDGVWSHNGLVVVGGGGAVRAVVAVDGVTCLIVPGTGSSG